MRCNKERATSGRTALSDDSAEHLRMIAQRRSGRFSSVCFAQIADVLIQPVNRSVQ